MPRLKLPLILPWTQDLMSEEAKLELDCSKMSGEIVNRVAKSPLITFDLEEIYPQGKRMRLDLSQWLEQGFILREKEFRAALKALDFSLPYQSAWRCPSLFNRSPATLSLGAFIGDQSFTTVRQKSGLGSLEDLNRHFSIAY